MPTPVKTNAQNDPSRASRNLEIFTSIPPVRWNYLLAADTRRVDSIGPRCFDQPELAEFFLVSRRRGDGPSEEAVAAPRVWTAGSHRLRRDRRCHGRIGDDEIVAFTPGLEDIYGDY